MVDFLNKKKPRDYHARHCIRFWGHDGAPEIATRGQPFPLEAVYAEQTPHSAVERCEPLDELANAASRLVGTFIHIHGDGTSQIVTVNAGGLALLLREGVMVPLDHVDSDGKSRTATTDRLPGPTAVYSFNLRQKPRSADKTYQRTSPACDRSEK